MTLRTAFLWILIISLSGAALLGIVVIIFPDMLPADDEILVTALLLGVYSLPSLACAIVLGRARASGAMWTGIVASPLAWAVWMPMVWGNPWNWRGDWDELFLKSGFSLTILAVWAAHLGLLTLLRLERAWFRRARVTTLVIGGGLSIVSVLALWLEIEEEWMFRVLAVGTILVSAGTIITPIFALIELLQRRSDQESVPSNLSVKLTCPRCRCEQDLPVGVQHCERCRLRIELNVEEPRCACGYLLYQLTGDRCPECGRQIENASLWRGLTPADAESGVRSTAGMHQVNQPESRNLDT